MDIRRACPGEGAVLSDLVVRSKAYWGYDDGFLEASRAQLLVSEELINDGRVFVGERDGTIVGVASLVGDPPEIELGHLFVDPTAMRNGIGRALFERAVDEARSLGARALLVESDPNAEAFYLVMGAARVGDRPSIVDPRRSLPLLRLQLH